MKLLSSTEMGGQSRKHSEQQIVPKSSNSSHIIDTTKNDRKHKLQVLSQSCFALRF